MQKNSTLQAKKYLTQAEIAIELGVSERTIARWIRIGKLKAFRLHNVTRIDPDDFEIFLKQNTLPEFTESEGETK